MQDGKNVLRSEMNELYNIDETHKRTDVIIVSPESCC